MKHWKPSTLAALAVGAIVSLGAAAIAQQYDDPTPADMMSGVVVTRGTGEIVVETSDGRKTFMVGDEGMMPAGLAEGDVVLIDVDSPGSLDAEKIMIVHDHIVVVADEESEGALLGIVTAISPQQLLVETTTGEQAFVINPEKLFPPLPEADQKVAVTYRTLDVHPPQHMATGLVVLPKDLDALSQSARAESSQALDSTSGEGTLEAIEEEAEAETAVATVPLAEPEVESEAVAEVESPEVESEFPTQPVEVAPTTESELAAAQTSPVTSTQADQPQQEDTFAQATDSEATFDDELPRTGSSLPLLVGVGALALGLAAVLRRAR